MKLVNSPASSQSNAQHHNSYGIYNYLMNKGYNDVQITDITGKQVYSINQATSETSIDLSSVQKGVYFAKLSGETGSKVEKIILK